MKHPQTKFHADTTIVSNMLPLT